MVQVRRRAMRTERGIRDGARGGQRAGRRPKVTLGLIGLLVLLAACATSPTAAHVPTKAAATPTVTVGPTATAAPTPIAITDLGAFRTRLVNAYSGNHWTRVVPLLSPQLSFQTEYAGSQLLMPTSLANLQHEYGRGEPWSQSSDYEMSVLSCYSGNTPSNQVIGFDGSDGHIILFGLNRYQGYWVVSWGFDDPIGQAGFCVTGD